MKKLQSLVISVILLISAIGGCTDTTTGSKTITITGSGNVVTVEMCSSHRLRSCSSICSPVCFE